MMRVSTFFVALLILCGLAETGWPISKAYMTNGETRVGFIHVLDGRVTIRGDDRLFQFPERAVHRIEHVTGDSTLVGKNDVFVREKPEKLSRNLIYVPKGCEVTIKSVTGDWVKIQVYGGTRFTEGFVLAEELNDSVYLNPPRLPNIKFHDPPPSLKDRYPDRKKPRQQITPEMLTSYFGGVNETDFGMLSQRIYGTTPQGVMDQQKALQEQKGTSTSRDEELGPRPVEPANQ